MTPKWNIRCLMKLMQKCSNPLVIRYVQTSTRKFASLNSWSYMSHANVGGLCITGQRLLNHNKCNCCSRPQRSAHRSILLRCFHWYRQYKIQVKLFRPIRYVQTSTHKKLASFVLVCLMQLLAGYASLANDTLITVNATIADRHKWVHIIQFNFHWYRQYKIQSNKWTSTVLLADSRENFCHSNGFC